MSSITLRLRQLFATLTAMTTGNHVLLEGEVWIEKDPATGFSTGRRKVGDGVTAFVDLPFEPSSGGGGGGGSTDLSIANRGATTLDIASSTGADVTVPAATTTLAGLLPAADKVKINALGTAAAADVGVAGGVAPLDGSAKIASAYLPSFVDDVVEAANFAALPGTGETGKIYVTINDGKTFRWGGSAYVEISPSPGSSDAVPEGSVNLYFTAARAIGAALTGFVSGAGAVAATDTILQAIQKIVGNLAGRALTGAIGSSGLTMATARLLGRGTAGAGAIEEITIGSGLDLTSGVLTAPGGGGTAAGSTGQVQYRASGGAFAGASGLVIDPASGQVTRASFLAGTAPGTPSTGFTLYAGSGNALSWVGANGFIRTFDGTANTADRTYTLPNASGTLALAGAIGSSGLTMSTARILGRSSASTGAVEEITVGSGLSLSGGTLTATGGGGGGSSPGAALFLATQFV